ncbi:HipA domain-containing protein [Sporichthya sp.]|uniref:HipA domain-containing protein n=1 Tax=Sporichthya sp. TaxID=65475 RepID=UPI0017E96F45|nr:HipA domain-containing protein [Sporichthya sp.]MBA3742328.1 HipA domain-containing protein [Sporichthya sp.]
MDLDLWLDGRRVARTESRDRGRKVRVVYEPEVVAEVGGEIPLLSCSLPTPGPSAPTAARAFLEGLLPEGRALEAAASRVRGVRLRDGHPDTPADVLAVLAEYGRECAGAVVVVPAGESGDQPGRYRPLGDGRLEAAIGDLPTRPLGADPARGIRMSLAGAQPKLLLARFGAKWFEALDGAASTHILKPDGVWEHSAQNEALVMTLARTLGLTDREVWVERVAGRSVFVTERFDRVVRGRRVRRLHQEDMCQAMGRLPASKYEIGRPSGGPARTLRVFTKDPQAEVERLFRYVAFRALVGDEDNHGKNYALLLSGRWASLAPMYDSLCTLMYPQLSGVMAAPIGAQANLLRVTSDALIDEARAMGLPEPGASAVLTAMAQEMAIALDALDGALTSGWPAERVIELIRDRVHRLQEGKPLGQGRARPGRRISLDEASARRTPESDERRP